MYSTTNIHPTTRLASAEMAVAVGRKVAPGAQKKLTIVQFIHSFERTQPIKTASNCIHQMIFSQKEYVAKTSQKHTFYISVHLY